MKTTLKIGTTPVALNTAPAAADRVGGQVTPKVMLRVPSGSVPIHIGGATVTPEKSLELQPGEMVTLDGAVDDTLHAVVAPRLLGGVQLQGALEVSRIGDVPPS